MSRLTTSFSLHYGEFKWFVLFYGFRKCWLHFLLNSVLKPFTPIFNGFLRLRALNFCAGVHLQHFLVKFNLNGKLLLMFCSIWLYCIQCWKSDSIMYILFSKIVAKERVVVVNFWNQLFYIYKGFWGLF